MFEKISMTPGVEKVKKTAKIIGLSTLLAFSSPDNAMSQDNSNNKLDQLDPSIELNIENLSPIELYENLSPEKALEKISIEEFEKFRKESLLGTKTDVMPAPFLQKSKQIEQESGLINPAQLDPNNYETKEDFIKDFIEKSLEYQEKVGKKLEKLKNDYYKGKIEHYTKSLTETYLKDFKGGYMCEDDLFLDGFLNKHYSEKEISEYQEALQNYIRTYNEDSSWRRWDYSLGADELQQKAEEYWELNKKVQEDFQNQEVTEKPDTIS